MARLLQIDQTTVKRLLDVIYDWTRVDIVWKSDRRLPGQGTYYVGDWGILDKQQVISHVIKAYGFREVHKVLNIRREFEGLPPIPAKPTTEL